MNFLCSKTFHLCTTTQGHWSNKFSLLSSVIPSSIQPVSFYKTFSWPYVLCQPCFIFTLLWSKIPHLILFILIVSDFSPLTFCPKRTPARLPPHHYIKVTKDLHAAESQFLLFLIDLSAFDAADHSLQFEMLPSSPPNIDFISSCVFEMLYKK